MKLKLYNTLTQKLETFTPQNPNDVKIYTCGPTVYGYQHIGNYASYVYWDLLLRVLLALGFTPRRVLNLTDVGHLTSDGDAGEDKMEKGARASGKTVWEVADFYAEDFLASYRALDLLPPAKLTRATDFIAADQRLVDRLFEKGYAYETSDGIYFDTSKFPAYADFARLDLDHLRAGARVEFSSEKRNAADFALWKFIQPGEDHAMQWEYRGRPGYPGWHLECSTIIHEVLGEPIDIHTGGIDHIPVHHTNEIAQSEAAYGRPLARFWLHCNFITVDGAKISKSLGNIYTLSDLADHGYAPLDYKMWVLQGHYQSERNFTFADLAGARNRRLAWRNRIALARQASNAASEQPDVANEHAGRAVSKQVASATSEEITELWTQILTSLADNLNSAATFALIDASEPTLAEWEQIDRVFGLGLMADTPEPPQAVLEMIAARETARQARDYAQADALRAEISVAGFAVLDTPDGPRWQYQG